MLLEVATALILASGSAASTDGPTEIAPDADAAETSPSEPPTVAAAERTAEATEEPEDATEAPAEATEDEVPAEPPKSAAPPSEPPKRSWRDRTRIPSSRVGNAIIQPWVRSTTFVQWYRENYNTQQSDDGFVALVQRLGTGTDVRLKQVTLGTQLRLDGQKIWFPDSQDCSGDCVPVEDDVRLERFTVSADTRYFSVQGGDFQASFGRGMGLSVRKVDLIGVDATIKGGRVDLRTKPVRVTGIAGFANRQNSDFATRQLIEDPGYPGQSYTFSPDTEDRGCNVDGALDPDFGNPLWTICSDLVAGGRVEGSLPGKVEVGAHHVYLDYGDEVTAGVVDEHSHLIGGDIARARIAGVWDMFVGASGIIRNPNLRGTPLEPQSFRGYGIYASNVFVAGTTTILVEAKHYQDYLLALSQNSLLQYAENPTLEREDQQVPGNQNATGARLRVDHTWRDLGLTVFGSSLEYAYSEDVGTSAFRSDGRLATHNYAGVIWRKKGTDFVLQVSGGYRYERFLDPPVGSPLRRRFPHAEFYVTIPVAKANGLTHTMSVRGEGRWENFRTVGSGEDFFRGLLTVGYSMSPWFSVSLLQGIDTELPTPPGEPSLTDEECEGGAGSTCRPHLWPGVQAQINLFGASFLRLFAGRQVGGRVCVNGSCRTLPDFEGVRSELVFSF